jgi:hypothetical protein
VRQDSLYLVNLIIDLIIIGGSVKAAIWGR